MDKTLLVLAAGIGSRYGGSKQIDPVGPNGEFLLDYSVFDAWRAGFTGVVFVTRPEFRAFLEERFSQVLEDKMKLSFVYQELSDIPSAFNLSPEREKPWGTAHAIWSARNVLQEPFAAINADDFYGQDAYKKLAEFFNTTAPNEQNSLACLVAYKLKNTLSAHGSVCRGLCTVEQGNLIKVVEAIGIEAQQDGSAQYFDEEKTLRTLSGQELVSMNSWGFFPQLFELIETEFISFLEKEANDPKAEFFIPTVVDNLIKAGKLQTRVLETDEKWFGMTYKEDKQEVSDCLKALIARGAYPAELW